MASLYLLMDQKNAVAIVPPEENSMSTVFKLNLEEVLKLKELPDTSSSEHEIIIGGSSKRVSVYDLFLEISKKVEDEKVILYTQPSHNSMANLISSTYFFIE